MKKLTFILIALSILGGCYTSKKLDRQVKATLKMDFAIQLQPGPSAKYIDKHTEEEYRQAFREGLKKELAYSNVQLVDENPEFEIYVTSFVISETVKNQTVTDSSSQYYGKTFELTKCDLTSSGRVRRPLTDEDLGDWSAQKDKEEKITNNRSFGQVITGTNKDGSVTRVKAFDDDTFITLAEQCGRRSAVRVVKLISRKAE